MNKIALIVDIKSWAFDIEAQILKKYLKDFYLIDIFVSSEYNDDLFSILEDVKNYDIIHFFWRKILIQFSSDEFINKVNGNNYNLDEYMKITKKISTGVYDHLFIGDINYLNIFTKYSKMYYTCSKKLENIYLSNNMYPKPYGTIHDTYEDNLYKFTDKNYDNNYLTIGWVGNSNWNIKYKDFKGFHSILEPVIDELINEGYLIRKHYADKNIIFRTNEQMPKYYSEIDLCIIVSTCEGTPRPLLESMACGVAIITTDIGIASEVLGPIQKEYILGSRDDGNNDEYIKNKLKEKIIYLYNNREELKKLSLENIKYSKNNGINHMYIEYKKYFDTFLNKKI